MDRRSLLKAAGSLAGLGLTGSALAAGKAKLHFTNADFCCSEGKFQVEKAKDAVLALCRHHGYPIFPGLREKLWVSDYGLNQFANLEDSGSRVAFTILDGIASGADFHWAMVTATYVLRRGAPVPVQMTFSSQHLASWGSTWWNRNQGVTVRHWISVRGYSGFWDGTYGPSLSYTDSAGGYGGATGNFTSASRLVYNLNQANSGRIVY